MDEVAKLEHLSLVSKICTELDNHLGLNDKDLAEFIIDLADKNPTFDAFKKALTENGAEFSDSFMTNLLRIIQHMKPINSKSETNEKERLNKNPLANKFPGLAIPNEKPVFSSDEESEDEKDKKKRLTTKEIFKDEKNKSSNDTVVDQTMAELEALAPSKAGIKKTEAKKEDDRKRVRSSSRDRKDGRSRRRDGSRDRKRSRSRHRRSRSRDKRSRSRDSRSRDRRRRSRSRQRHRSKSRDKDRRRRSRSRGRRSKSRERRSPSRDRDQKDRFGDFGKKGRKKSPEVEMSDDPEPGKGPSDLSLFRIAFF